MSQRVESDNRGVRILTGAESVLIGIGITAVPVTSLVVMDGDVYGLLLAAIIVGVVLGLVAIKLTIRSLIASMVIGGVIAFSAGVVLLALVGAIGRTKASYLDKIYLYMIGQTGMVAFVVVSYVKMRLGGDGRRDVVAK